jgi:uncharacterized membrane protein
MVSPNLIVSGLVFDGLVNNRRIKPEFIEKVTGNIWVVRLVSVNVKSLPGARIPSVEIVH